MGKARREQQRGRLAEDAADRQDAAGDDAVHAAGQHHGADDTPLARTEAERALAVALRHGFEALLRGAHDGRQVHDDERERAGQQRCFHVQKLAEKQHAYKAVDNGRDAGERLGRVLDGADEPAVRGVLGQVDGCAHAERQDDQQRGDHNIERVENVRQDADAVRQVARRGGQQRPRHVRQTLDEHVGDQKQHECSRDDGRRTHEDAHGEDIGPATAGNGFLFHLSPSLLRLRKKLSVALMSMMNKNSTSAMENSACRCRPLE